MVGESATPLQWSIFALDGGTGDRSSATEQPLVLVLSRESANRALPVVTVVPLKGMKPDRRVYPNEACLPSEATRLDGEAVLMAHQIRTLPKDLLSTRMARVDDPDLRTAIRSAIRVQLDLDDLTNDSSAATTPMGE